MFRLHSSDAAGYSSIARLKHNIHVGLCLWRDIERGTRQNAFTGDSISKTCKKVVVFRCIIVFYHLMNENLSV